MGRIGFLPVLGTMKACEMPRLRKLMLSENDLTPSLCVLLVSVLNSNEELIVNELDLSDNQISDGGCGAIANFLAFSNEEYIDEEINTLNIASNDIGPKSLGRLFYSLNMNLSLTYLNISRNMVGKEGVHSLNEMLGSNKALQHLVLQDVGIDDTCIGEITENLAKNKSLISLDLAKNAILSSGAVKLCEALLGNSELLMLSLAACQIDAKAGPILADLVMNTKALEDLNLSSNPLGDTAVLALNLATTRQKNSSMGIMLSLQNCSGGARRGDQSGGIKKS